jgi:hypothetical protein
VTKCPLTAHLVTTVIKRHTLKKNLLKFENEFIDIENHEFDGKKWEERGMRNQK